MNAQADPAIALKPDERIGVIAPFLIVVLGVLAYANSLSGVFIFDDTVAISSNPAVKQIMSPLELIDEPKLGKTRPLVLFTFQLNHALGGDNVWGYHLVNFLIHITAGLLLYGIVRRTLSGHLLSADYGQSATALAAVCAAVWVVHPLQTQSVTYIVQRCESLCCLFYLLTLYSVIRGNERGDEVTRRSRTIGWNTTAVVACAAGMLSKAVMVTAPVVVLIYDRIFLSRSFGELLRRRWPLYSGLASTWIILFWLRWRVPPRNLEQSSRFYEDSTAVEYLATQAGVLVHYLRLAFWPYPLCLDYNWPKVDSLSDTWLPGSLILVLLLVTAILLWRRPPAGFLGVWFFGVLAPTSSFVPIFDIAVEHRMYLPLAAVVVAVVLGAFNLARRLPVSSATLRAAGTATAVVVIGLFVVMTYLRNADYHSRLAMWTQVASVRPDNARAHFNVGLSLTAERRFEEAIAPLERAVEIMPDFEFVMMQLAVVHLELRNPSEAERWLQEVLRIRPGIGSANYMLGLACQRQGKIGSAIRYYQAAIDLEPTSFESHFNLGVLFVSEGRFADAIQHFEITVSLRPESMEAQSNLRWARRELSKRQLDSGA